MIDKPTVFQIEVEKGSGCLGCPFHHMGKCGVLDYNPCPNTGVRIDCKIMKGIVVVVRER